MNAFLMYPKSSLICQLHYVTHETVNSNKTRFPRFDKILVIWRMVYGESNERQLCSEIADESEIWI